jgi:hypothetical protein
MWSVVSGTAVLAPGGAARIGLTYTFPGAVVTEGALIRASINLDTFSGAWDDNGNRAAFVHFVNQLNRPLTGGAANITCFSHPLTDGNRTRSYW